MTITHDQLLHRLRYDEDSGRFFWRNPNPRSRGIKSGDEAGLSVDSSGYRQVCVDGTLYLSHRLAWFYVYGEWPNGELTHHDGRKTNNAIKNLDAGTRIHGWYGKRTWRIWKGMRQRCNDPGCKDYGRYGARGISVCERWNDFSAFLEDMGPAPDGMSIDRIDGGGNYEPSNCRWADHMEQAKNRPTTNLISYQGEMLTLPVAAKRAGIAYQTLYHRIKRGCAPHELFEPARRRGAKRTAAPA